MTYTYRNIILSTDAQDKSSPRDFKVYQISQNLFSCVQFKLFILYRHLVMHTTVFYIMNHFRDIQGVVQTFLSQ